MDFIVVSRQEIEEGIVVRTPYVVVSITDPGTPRPRIRRPAGFRDALYLKFHDAVPSENAPLPAGLVLMTKKHARKIWDFVLRYRDEVGTAVVQCEQGMSRSPAVAAAICKALNGNDSRFFADFQPNEYVYHLVRSTAAAHANPERS